MKNNDHILVLIMMRFSNHKDCLKELFKESESVRLLYEYCYDYQDYWVNLKLEENQDLGL